MADESVKDGLARLNVTIGAMDGTANMHTFIFTIKDRSINSEVVVKKMWECLLELWDTDEGIREHANQIILFITDGAAYMKKAGQLLKDVFTQMLHLSCVTHGLHLVAEDLRKHLPQADRGISLFNEMRYVQFK